MSEVARLLLDIEKLVLQLALLSMRVTGRRAAFLQCR